MAELYMDALAFLRERTKTRLGRVVFCLLCLMPVAGGVIGHFLGRHAWSFMDIDAVLCAARAEAAGHVPYGALVCPGLAPAPYVYAPQVAAMFIPLVRALGGRVARLLYLLVLFVPALLALSWYALRKTVPEIDWRYRLLAISGLAPMAFCSGNFGIPMHAAVIFSLVALPRRRWLFTAVVLACVAIKPTFLLYFAVPLFESRPWRQRLIIAAGSVVAGLGVVAAMALTAGPWGAAWGRALAAVALHDQPGLGWYALTAALRLPPDAFLSLGLTIAFMAAMAASGVAIAEAADLGDEERRILALGLVPLLTPRLMDYDMLALAPSIAVLMRLLPAVGGRIWRYNLSWILAGGLGFGIAANLLHFHRWPRSHAAMALFCVMVLLGGARLALKELEKGRGPRQRKKREKATLGGPLHVRRVTGGEGARGEVAGKIGG
jgi:hypothetical protein